MPKRICAKAGCVELIPFTDKYCEVHIEVGNDKRKEQARVYSKSRYDNDPTYQRFYNSAAWKRVRDNVMRDWDYTCRLCWERDGIYTRAVLVDHIIEVRDDWDMRLEYSNLQPLCTKCHNIKTYNERLKREEQ